MKATNKTFTHIDPESNHPAMVDVSSKEITRRTARAQSIVILGDEIMKHLHGNDIQTKKGPVFQTAIIAGTMAAKRTADLIPLCHPLALEDCKVEITINDEKQVVIQCTAVVSSKTGVEMEALTGASIAALTIYDMCKAFSQQIVIKETRLMEKTGGKHDYRDNHQKHAGLVKAQLGEFHRNELAVLGTACGNIRRLANSIIQELYLKYNMAYIDADHKAPDDDDTSVLNDGANMEFIDKITYRSFNYKHTFNRYQNSMLFNEQDIVLVNGNHFEARSQILVVDPSKPLNNKLAKLTNIHLVLLADGVDAIPDHIMQLLPPGSAVPVLKFNDTLSIADFVDRFITQHTPAVNGLVLAGGQSLRMQTDKGSLKYFGHSQRVHVHNMLSKHCAETYVSFAAVKNIDSHEELPVILDSFTNLGPLGGILSAFRHNPNVAWFTLACDLPYLTAETLAYLIDHRNTSKVATCFIDSDGKFPEPLVTIWEPRAYPVIMQFLAQGYSCPRKVLINSDVELLQAPIASEFKNVNYPDEQQAAMLALDRSS